MASLWKRWWRPRWRKVFTVIAIALVVAIGSMYGLARWYIHSQAAKPLVLGTSFIPAYAESLGLDPQATMQALIDDVGVRHFRLVSYWDQLEPAKGQYDFSLLDWQFAKAEQSGSKVTLSLGLRQPRWPECHMPRWAMDEPVTVWQPQLQSFMVAVVERYKNSPALGSYQVENEYFLKGFGLCTNFDRSRLVAEYNAVKRADPAHTAIIARSNNGIGWPTGKPAPDEYGISIYRRVWDAQLTHTYITYPIPAWYYAFLAGWQQLVTGRGMIIHELQAEAWAPNNKTLTEISLAEQNKSFNAGMFASRVDYGRATGTREMYLWGSEYWYYRKVKLGDDSVWQAAVRAYH